MQDNESIIVVRCRLKRPSLCKVFQHVSYFCHRIYLIRFYQPQIFVSASFVNKNLPQVSGLVV